MSTRPFAVCGALALSLLAACSRPAAAPALSAAQAKPSTEPAKGPTTVEAIWTTKDTLAGKTVTVSGKVVKFNGGILGVNWIHIQDGTGNAKARTNDITVTSEDEAQVGDTVTVTGVLGLNKDIGSGYSYPVIIERARVERAVTARQ